MPAQLDGTGGPHVLVADVATPELAPDDHHHLSRVRRVRTGDPITVGDGHGRWRTCRFGDTVEIVGEIVTEPAPTPKLTVAFALVKGERPEWVTQKLTELGIDVIVPFVAARSVVRWDERRIASNLDRLTRVAREATMQCRRAWLPVIEPLATFDDVIDRDGVALAQQGGQMVDESVRTVLIGPEGGWTPEELDHDVAQVTLGAHVLRADTAAIAAGTLLSARRAGLT